MTTSSPTPEPITVNFRTGHSYRGSFNFNEGKIDSNGTFVPRYWGLARSDGQVTDTHCFRVLPLLNSRETRANTLPGAHDLNHQFNEELRDNIKIAADW